MQLRPIKKLPDTVIAAIAAGEVAERPSVILKELLDNAIDAGASQITVTLENSGLDKIVVSDNGHGILEADLPLAIERYTTSKIQTLEDFLQIQTMGFRGEALSSIADVAQLSIQSKPQHQEIGCELLAGPEFEPVIKPLGMPDGTTITVSELFTSLPARKKFLKNPETELRLCISVITALALAFPEINFDLYNNQKSLFHAPATADIAQRIVSLFTPEFKYALINLPPTQTETGFAISGYIGLPQIARRTKSQQYVFLNHRPISFPTASRVIKDTYGSLLEPRSEPVFFMYIEAPPTEIDINVHPRKETARFSHEQELVTALRDSISSILHQQDLTYVSTPAGPMVLRDSAANPYLSIKRTDRTASTSTSTVLKKIVETWQVSSSEAMEVLQLHLTYLLAQTDDGLLLVDQHAAHERILYEQFLAAFQQTQSQPEIMTLKKPAIIELSVIDSQLLQTQLETLSQIGLGIEHFGGSIFKLHTLPKVFADRQPSQLLKDLLDDLHEGRDLDGVDSAAHRSLAFLACRHAVKAGDVLSMEQRRELIEKLAKTNSNFTCPHGRPVSVVYRISDLERLFKRKK